MADRKVAFGSATAITCSLAGLTTGNARQSTAIDNTSNLYLDAIVYLAVKTGSGTIGSDKAVYVYVFGSEDGTNYDETAGATDAGYTMVSPSNLRLLDVIATAAVSTTYKKVIPSVAAAFNGILPPKWGLVLVNKTNTTLDATEGNHAKDYRGIYETIV